MCSEPIHRKSGLKVAFSSLSHLEELFNKMVTLCFPFNRLPSVDPFSVNNNFSTLRDSPGKEQVQLLFSAEFWQRCTFWEPKGRGPKHALVDTYIIHIYIYIYIIIILPLKKTTFQLSG